jgi:hypothetical protein
MAMPEYAPGKRPTIKGLIPGLTEVGKIKIGCKGEERPTRDGKGVWQVPIKLDHFLVTTLERGKDNNFLRDNSLYARLKFSDKPKEIPIVLLFDSVELNFQSRYVCYVGRTLACSGDGDKAITADRKIIECPCPKKEPTYKGSDKCKMHGCLSCMIRGAGSVGGVWKFRTTGYNSTVGIHSSLMLISTLTGGMLAGIPLKLYIAPKVATNPDDQKSLTIFVVGVTFDGDIDALQQQTLRIVQRDATFRQRLLSVEETVAKSMSVDAEIVDQAGDINEEFNPLEDSVPGPGIAETPAAIVQAPAPTIIPDAPCDMPVTATAPVTTPTAPPMPTIEMPDLFK